MAAIGSRPARSPPYGFGVVGSSLSGGRTVGLDLTLDGRDALTDPAAQCREMRRCTIASEAAVRILDERRFHRSLHAVEERVDRALRQRPRRIEQAGHDRVVL